MIDRQETCFGFQVVSNIPIEFGRTGSGIHLDVAFLTSEEPAHPGELIYEWPRIPDKRARTALFSDGSSYEVAIDTYQSFQVDPFPPSIRVWGDTEPAMREALLWGTPVALCAIHGGRLIIHAASVEIGGRALLLAAPTTAGKTTLAAAFHANGFRALSDDLSCCWVDDDGVWLHPGPAVLRLRPDIAETLELDHTLVPYQSDSKVYHAIERGRRGSADAVPLAGIVFLREDDTGPSVHPCDPKAALRDLWNLSFFLPTDEDHERCFAGLARLVATTKQWNLHRPLTLDGLPEVVDTVAALEAAG